MKGRKDERKKKSLNKQNGDNKKEENDWKEGNFRKM